MDASAEGLDELLDVLDRAEREILPGARKVVSKGALNIKKDWRDRWSGLSHAPQLASAITYDTAVDGDEASAEIGPDKSRPQGPLGNLVEFGSVHNAPRPGGLPALDAEAPRFEQALGDLGEQLLAGE